jgi:hypothetical protein
MKVFEEKRAATLIGEYKADLTQAVSKRFILSTVSVGYCFQEFFGSIFHNVINLYHANLQKIPDISTE